MENDESKKKSFIPIILRDNCNHICDFPEILKEYEEINGKMYDYNESDESMIEILRKNNLLGNSSYFSIVYLKICFVKYYRINRLVCCDSIEINYDRYKIDLIKKLISSEMLSEDIVSLTEGILFQTITKGYFTEHEYISHLD